LFKIIKKEAGYVVFYPHGAENNHKLFILFSFIRRKNFRLTNYLRGKAVMRKTVARKYRKFLSAD
jgi:hypothetical protein